MHKLFFHSSGLGRVQSFLPQLLYDTLGKTEQQMSTLSARLGGTENWKVTTWIHVCCDKCLVS